MVTGKCYRGYCNIKDIDNGSLDSGENSGDEKYSDSRFILKVCFPNSFYVDVREKEESRITLTFWARVMEKMLFPLTEIGKTISECGGNREEIRS